MSAEILTPWEMLLQEAKNAEQFTECSEIHTTENEFWLGLCILTGDDLFLTPINEIVEIMPVPNMSLLPHVKSWLRGLAICRGEILAITDLSGLLKDKLTRITKHARILMLPVGDSFCGLLVDKILGLHRMPMHEIKPILKGEYPQHQKYLSGKYENKKTALPIISLRTITEDRLFYEAYDNNKNESNKV